MATMQDVFSHVYTTEAHLGDVPVKNGQIILCADSEKLYIDHGTTRVSTSDVVQVENQEALPLAPLDKLYTTKDTGDIFFYINGVWKKLTDTIDLSNYETSGAISLNAAISEAALHLDSTGAQLEGAISVTIQSGNGIHLSQATGLYLNDAGLNQPGGLVQLGSDGKLPTSILPESSGGSVDLSNYEGDGVSMNLTADFEVHSGEIKLDATGNLYLTAFDLFYNGAASNTPNGLVLLGDDGKIPTSLYDAGSGGGTDLSNYVGGVDITSTGNMSIRNGQTGDYSLLIGMDQHYGLNITNKSSKTINLTANLNGEGTIEIVAPNVSMRSSTNGTQFFKHDNSGIALSHMSAITLSSGDNQFAVTAAGITFNGAATNTAGSLVQLDSNGKIPTSLYDAGSGGGSEIDWSNVNAELISFSADAGMAFSSYGQISISGGDLLINTSSINFGEAGGTVITFDLSTLDDLKIFHADTATTSTPNTAGGFAIVGSDGKLPASILPESSGGTADSVAWENVTGKPSTFPPADHTHEIANVNGLQAALDAKGTVKSVNGVTPDGSGNVTIETGGGGTVDLSNYHTTGAINLSADSGIKLKALGVSFNMTSSGANVTIPNAPTSLSLNNHLPNTAGGFVIVPDDGKLPASILPASGALVYNVVASATEPENPTEGMIWIQTT